MGGSCESFVQPVIKRPRLILSRAIKTRLMTRVWVLLQCFCREIGTHVSDQNLLVAIQAPDNFFDTCVSKRFQLAEKLDT